MTFWLEDVNDNLHYFNPSVAGVGIPRDINIIWYSLKQLYNSTVAALVTYLGMIMFLLLAIEFRE